MKNTNPTNESNTNVDIPNIDKTSIPKKPVKPPKLEDKPFDEFITNYFIPGLKKSILEKGTNIKVMKLIEEERPVVWVIANYLMKESFGFVLIKN